MSIQDLNKWNRDFLRDIKLIVSGEQPGRKPCTFRRVCMHMACPLICTPCFLWSALWRILACPCMVFHSGCGYACSDNGCTACSDSAIEKWCESTDEEPLGWIEHLVRSDTPARVALKDTLWSAVQQIDHCSDMHRKYKASILVNQALESLHLTPVSLISQKISRKDIDRWFSFSFDEQ